MTTTQGAHRPRTLFCTTQVPGSSPDPNSTYQCMNSAFVITVARDGGVMAQCPMCKTTYRLEDLAHMNGVVEWAVGVVSDGVVSDGAASTASTPSTPSTADDFAAVHSLDLGPGRVELLDVDMPAVWVKP